MTTPRYLHWSRKNETYLIKINRTVMSDAAREYLETHDWDDITGTLADGVELAKRLRTSITLEDMSNTGRVLIKADGTHASLDGF